MKSKQNKKSRNKTNDSFAGILLILIVFGIGYILLSQTGIVAGISQKKIAESNTNFPTFSVSTATPTATPTSKQTTSYQQQTVNTDPTIPCTVENIGVVQLKQSVCAISFACQVGTWKLYQSKEKCTQDQKAYYGSKNTGKATNTYTYPTYAYPTYTPSSYYLSCPTILGQKTAYGSTEQQAIDKCTELQAQDQQYAEQTIQIQQQQQAIYEQQVEQCKANVSQWLSQHEANCATYGGTSAYDVCVQSVRQQANSMIASCGQ